METNSRITIAVAVYNVGSHLRNCLDSIITQTYGDFDILAVDDGSTDDCAAILDEYAARDPRLTVIHQKNAGVSMARNAAIDACKTRWIWLIDGDDAIENDAVETLMGAKNDDLDIIVTGKFKGVLTGQTTELDERWRSLAARRVLCMLPAAQDPYGMSANQWASVCIRLFSVPFLRDTGIRLMRGLNKSQDVLFNFECHLSARRVGLMEAKIYIYTPHVGTSVTRRMNGRIPEYAIMLTDALEKLVKEQGSAELDEALSNNVLLQVMTAIELYFGNAMNKDPYERRLKEFRAFLDAPSIRRGLQGMGRIDETVARLVYPAIKRGNLRLAAFILRANKKLRRAAKRILGRA